MQEKIINDGNIIRVSIDKKLPYSKGVGEIIFEKLNANKQFPLQIDGVTGEVDTCSSVLQRCIRTAIKMRSMGITREDVITVCSYNHLNTNIPILASFLLGVKVASIDPSLSLSDIIHLLKLVKPKMIFVSQNGVKLIEHTIREIKIDSVIVVFGESTNYTKFSEFLSESPQEEANFAPVEIKNLKETASIFFSSGTSGLAKAVCLSHLSLISQFPSEAEIEPLSGFTTLAYSSPYWISSLVMLMNCIITKGSRLVLPKFEIENFWSSIDKYKVFFMILSATHVATICSSKKPENIDTSNLKVVFASGSTIYKDQLERMKQLLPNTIVASEYGQTELGGGCIHFQLDSDEIQYMFLNPTSCGRPISGYTYKVVDLETEKSLGPNRKGELRVKTEFCMNGYYNMDSSSSWDSDGFIKTGDIAYYDEDYCFYIVDRIKDMLKFQGYQIAPAKLESILLSHPAVETALVIGLPHQVDGDHPTGIIRLKDSAPNVTVEEILKYYNQRIDDDRHRLRGGLKIVDDIPVTATGKYKKRYLKKLILSGKLKM